MVPEDPRFFPEAKIGETPKPTIPQRARALRLKVNRRYAGLLPVWLALGIFATLAKSCRTEP